MATSYSEPTRVGDVLKWEVFQGFCREKRVALSGETLNIGSIVEFDSDVDEVQTCSVFTGTGTAGTYTITFWDAIAGTFVTTAPIADAADLATINAALDAAAAGLTAGVVASGTIESTSWVLTYSGPQYKGIDVPLATVDVSSWTGVTACTFAETTPGSTAAAKMKAIVVPKNTAGICLENLGTLAADANAMFLTQGPAIVDQDQLDYNSQSVAETNQALKALGIKPVLEPATLVTQTT